MNEIDKQRFIEEREILNTSDSLEQVKALCEIAQNERVKYGATLKTLLEVGIGRNTELSLAIEALKEISLKALDLADKVASSNKPNVEIAGK